MEVVSQIEGEVPLALDPNPEGDWDLLLLLVKWPLKDPVDSFPLVLLA